MKKLILFIPFILSCSLSIGQSTCFADCYQLNRANGAFIKALQSLVGCQLPEFEATSINGIHLKSSDLKGKVIVMNFWFTSCSPCVMEIPALNQLVADHKSDSIVFIAIGRDKKSEIDRFLKIHQFNYLQIPDDQDFTHKFCVFGGWPMHIVADRKGIVTMIKSGGGNNDETVRIQLAKLDSAIVRTYNKRE